MFQVDRNLSSVDKLVRIQALFQVRDYEPLHFKLSSFFLKSKEKGLVSLVYDDIKKCNSDPVLTRMLDSNDQISRDLTWFVLPNTSLNAWPVLSSLQRYSPAALFCLAQLSNPEIIRKIDAIFDSDFKFGIAICTRIRDHLTVYGYLLAKFQSAPCPLVARGLTIVAINSGLLMPRLLKFLAQNQDYLLHNIHLVSMDYPFFLDSTIYQHIFSLLLDKLVAISKIHSLNNHNIIHAFDQFVTCQKIQNDIYCCLGILSRIPKASPHYFTNLPSIMAVEYFKFLASYKYGMLLQQMYTSNPEFDVSDLSAYIQATLSQASDFAHCNRDQIMLFFWFLYPLVSKEVQMLITNSLYDDDFNQISARAALAYPETNLVDIDESKLLNTKLSSMIKANLLLKTDDAICIPTNLFCNLQPFDLYRIAIGNMNRGAHIYAKDVLEYLCEKMVPNIYYKWINALKHIAHGFWLARGGEVQQVQEAINLLSFAQTELAVFKNKTFVQNQLKLCIRFLMLVMHKDDVEFVTYQSKFYREELENLISTCKVDLNVIKILRLWAQKLDFLKDGYALLIGLPFVGIHVEDFPKIRIEMTPEISNNQIMLPKGTRLGLRFRGESNDTISININNQKKVQAKPINGKFEAKIAVEADMDKRINVSVSYVIDGMEYPCDTKISFDIKITGRM